MQSSSLDGPPTFKISAGQFQKSSAIQFPIVVSISIPHVCSDPYLLKYMRFN